MAAKYTKHKLHRPFKNITIRFSCISFREIIQLS